MRVVSDSAIVDNTGNLVSEYMSQVDPDSGEFAQELYIQVASTSGFPLTVRSPGESSGINLEAEGTVDETSMIKLCNVPLNGVELRGVGGNANVRLLAVIA